MTRFPFEFIFRWHLCIISGPPQFKDKGELNEWIARPSQASVDFKCSVCGSPEPNITWYVGGRQINSAVSGGKVRIPHNTHSYSLTICVHLVYLFVYQENNPFFFNLLAMLPFLLKSYGLMLKNIIWIQSQCLSFDSCPYSLIQLYLMLCSKFIFSYWGNTYFKFNY